MKRLHLEPILRRTGLRRLMPRALRTLMEMTPNMRKHYGRLPTVMPAVGRRRATVALFLGCVADGVFPQTNLATARVLQQNGCEVWIPPSQTCCGALDYHENRASRARRFAESNLHAFAKAPPGISDVDAVITNAAGCGAMLKDYGRIFAGTELAELAARFAAKTQDVSQFVIELGMIQPIHRIDLSVTYHDACHLRHAQQVFVQPRRLLQAIPGLALLPLADSEMCCGAAGSYSLTQPDMASRLGDRKARHIVATGADAVVTGNVGCLMQIGKHLRQQGAGRVRVYHPIDILDAAYRGTQLA